MTGRSTLSQHSTALRRVLWQRGAHTRRVTEGRGGPGVIISDADHESRRSGSWRRRSLPARRLGLLPRLRARLKRRHARRLPVQLVRHVDGRHLGRAAGLDELHDLVEGEVLFGGVLRRRGRRVVVVAVDARAVPPRKGLGLVAPVLEVRLERDRRVDFAWGG